MRCVPWWVAVALWASVPATPVPLEAQAFPPSSAPLAVFFDCSTIGCDFDLVRREIPVVDWVRDREVADLHLLITSQGTGSGGRQVTLSFIGLRGVAGQDQELTVTTSGDATSDEQRRALVDRLKLGLVRYLAGTPAAERIRVSMTPDLAAVDPDAADPTAAAGAGAGGEGAQETEDPWDSWVFNLGLNGNANGESRSSSNHISTSLSGNRTTEAWKLTFSGRYSRNASRFELDDDRTIRSRVEDWSASGLVVKSLSPHWSVGSRWDAGRSTRRNEDMSWAVAPGIEYNIFPYSESSRRSFTIQALLNVNYWDWTEETIYGELEETRVSTSLTAGWSEVQPWGRASLSLTGSQYLHDSDLNSLSLGGSFSWRIFRGFSINASGNYSWVRNQLFPQAGNLSEEEILLRLRSQQTSYSYFTSFGISYRFGSILNNVVNPRFGGGIIIF